MITDCRLCRLIGLLVLAAGLLTGCGRAAPGDIPELEVLVSIQPSPPVPGPATVTATLRNTDGTPLQGAAVRFEGTMSHAGMAPVEAQARETAPGRYEAPLEFTMAGEWIIIVRASLPDGRTLERPITIGDVKRSP